MLICMAVNDCMCYKLFIFLHIVHSVTLLPCFNLLLLNTIVLQNEKPSSTCSTEKVWFFHLSFRGHAVIWKVFNLLLDNNTETNHYFRLKALRQSAPFIISHFGLQQSSMKCFTSQFYSRPSNIHFQHKASTEPIKTLSQQDKMHGTKIQRFSQRTGRLHLYYLKELETNGKWNIPILIDHAHCWCSKPSIRLCCYFLLFLRLSTLFSIVHPHLFLFLDSPVPMNSFPL